MKRTAHYEVMTVSPLAGWSWYHGGMATEEDSPQPESTITGEGMIRRQALREFLTAEAELAGSEPFASTEYVNGVRDGLTLVWERFGLDQDDPDTT